MALFGKKDLGLFLPDDTPGDAASLRHTKTRDTVDTAAKAVAPAVDASTKVRRYRAGQVPEFAHGYEEERGFVTAGQKVRAAARPEAARKGAVRRRFEAQVVGKAKRPIDEERASPDGGQLETKGSGSGSAAAAASDDDIGNALDDSSSEEEDAEIDRRRAARRAKMMQSKADDGGGERLRQEPIVIEQKIASPKAAETESSSSSASGSEWETDSDDSSDADAMMKPVFVPKKARDTIKRQEELAAEEEQRQRREAERAEARKLESRKLVAEELQREREGDVADMTDTDMPDDTDGLDPEQEYRDWELREMRRIKRDRDRREQRRMEEAETNRRRNMTEAERLREDEKLNKNAPKEKKKWKFMQKYYHKGVFYMDETSVRDSDDVRKRDASGATLEDNFNKEMLPKVMQVKNFGRAGQTKYTHLADQDTSTRDSLWTQRDAIREKFKSRLSGTRDLDSLGAKRRKTS